MIKAAAVIGANYGDEGKGLVTDYLSSPESTVVRFNGSAQAGHTVVCPDGRSHVFRHFGAGSFRGAKTFLSKHFLVNPLVYKKELSELKELGVEPEVYADPGCHLVTPYDMIINQYVERKRGDKRHGSCGMGVNEAVVRSSFPNAGLSLRLNDFDLGNTHKVLGLVNDIRVDYLPYRLSQLGMSLDDIPEHLLSYKMVETYLENLEFVCQHLKRIRWNDYASNLEIDGYNFVFEGAQGLMLDELNGNYPHVTRSRTGTTNIAELLKELNTEVELDIYYVTRTYVTRHGRDDKFGNVSIKPYRKISDDKTNRINEFQGEFMYSELDNELMQKYIEHDYEKVSEASDKIITTKNMVLTHCDQLDFHNEEPCVIANHYKLTLDLYMERLLVSFKRILTSYGRTRLHIINRQNDGTDLL